MEESDWLPEGCYYDHPLLPPFGSPDEWFQWVEGWRPSWGQWGDPAWFGDRLVKE